MVAIPSYIAHQYNRAERLGWIPFFREHAAAYGFRTEDILAIASRESNLQNIKGDYHDGAYHGYSLMQLDIGSYRAWIKSGKWENDVSGAIKKGCEALAEKRDQIEKASKQKVCSIKFRSGSRARFTPKPFTQEQLRSICIAAYNCGLASYYHFSSGRSVDAGTTQKNYSKDVLNRSRHFATLLARSDGAVASEDVEAKLTQEPTAAALAAPDDFATLQRAYSNHADLVESETAKSVFTKLGIKIGTGVAAVWGTTTGKVTLVLTALIVVGLSAYTIYKYRARVKAFFKGVKNWIIKA